MMELLLLLEGLANVLAPSELTPSVEGAHVVKEDAALITRRGVEMCVWSYLSHGLWEDSSAIVEP